MDFCKKNLAKLAIAILSLVGLVLMIVNLATVGGRMGIPTPFMSLGLEIGIAVLFAGIVVYLVCDMFGVCRCAKAALLIATALITSVFITFVLVHFIRLDASRHIIILHAAQLIAFGLFPFVFGLKKLSYRKRERKIKPEQQKEEVVE